MERLVDVGGLPDLVNHLVLGICLEFRIVRHQHKSPKKSAKSFKSRNWNDNLHDLHMDFPYNIKISWYTSRFVRVILAQGPC